MKPDRHFKLTRQALFLATLSAAFPVTGYASAGRMDFVIGNVESIAANGTRRALGKGAEINPGETINTARGARAQVRFADGGFVSLQPNTQFRVDEFSFKDKADGEEKGFFSLLKGGFRAITGAIGRVNKKAYRVKTAAATLGIRGTGYNMELRDDGLFVHVGEGAISLDNSAGLLVVTAGGAAYVADFNTAPVPTGEQPLTSPNGLPEPLFTVADERGSDGSLLILPTQLVSGPGYVMAYAYTAAGPSFSANLDPVVAATFSSTSQLTGWDSGEGDLGSATVSFSVTDGIIGWGRWVGDMTVVFSPLTNATFDYVIGIPTASMPTSGTATYSLMGYTNPTATDGSSGYSVAGTLSADFLNMGVGVDMTVGNGSSNTYAINGTVAMSGATFSGSTVENNFTNCTLGCTTSVNGFFAGSNASRAGLSYSIHNNFNNNDIQGVAAFSRD